MQMIQFLMGMGTIPVSSDYSPCALDPASWTHSGISVVFHLMMIVSALSLVTHGADVGSSQAPHSHEVMGPIGNLVSGVRSLLLPVSDVVMWLPI